MATQPFGSYLLIRSLLHQTESVNHLHPGTIFTPVDSAPQKPTVRKLRTLITCGFLLAASLTPLFGSAEFWVSPSGDDSQPGTEAAPFQTLTRARDAVRNVDPAHIGPITVHLFGGVYRLTQPLQLGPEDSGRPGHYVTWRAVDNETPIISGAIPISSWHADPDRPGIYYASVPTGSATRQLYINGQRAQRARTPDYPASFLPNATQGIQFEVTEWNPASWRNPTTWHNPDQIEAVLITQWKMMICGVESVSETAPGEGYLLMDQPAWNNANCFVEEQNGELIPGLWSFWQVTRFENSLSFLDEPGEWVLDPTANRLYYMPLADQPISEVVAELPTLESLITGTGTPGNPIARIRFENLTFQGATWLRPGGLEGYVVDQSGFYLVGENQPNLIGHIQPNTLGDPDRLGRTPGSVSFSYAHHIDFLDNRFQNLGSVALDFGTGSQHVRILRNHFHDIASSAIQIGGIWELDHHPPTPDHLTADNLAEQNRIERTGLDYVDSAAIFIRFTARSLIRNNTITHVPWSGIALGWGWGLLDPGAFPGLPGATPNLWKTYTSPTAQRENKILNNRIENFLQVVWDGGAIYTTGFQGQSASTGTLIAGNVALNKRPSGGGNTFYTDGGSRHLTLMHNVSFNNPIGQMNFGPFPNLLAPLPYSGIPSLLNGIPYGKDTGGCRTFGDIHYIGNYWLHHDFFSVCPYTCPCGISYPVRLSYRNNTIIDSLNQVPDFILRNAGVTGASP